MGDCIGSDSPAVSLTRPLGSRTVVDDRTGRDIITTALDTGLYSFYLDDVDPASVASIRVPTNDGYVVAHVAAPPDGGPGVCIVDAFGTLPGRVIWITPGADRTLVVPLRSEGQPTVFMDERVAQVTLRSDREPERELLVMDVPGVALARITQATTEVGFETDVDATLAFYDSSGRELTLAAFHPPDE